LYDLTDFDKEVLKASHSLPVLVEFWAPWCEPCGWLEPILLEMLSESGGRWSFIKINTDEQQEIADRYHIRGVPAVRVFYKGEIIASYNGMMFKKEYSRWLEDHLQKISAD
jgi:putative thioredoxin